MRLIGMTLVSLLAVCAPVAAQSIGGTYRIDGTNFDGSRYGGTARIVITSNTTCEIFWDTGGGATAEGICMRNGPAFTAAYVMGNAIGLVIYEILPDGTLDGLWTVAGQRGNGTEVLTPR